MTDDLPKAVHSATFRLFGVEVHCHVLQDGRRIIEADSMVALLEAMERVPVKLDELEAFARWQRGLARAG